MKHKNIQFILISLLLCAHLLAQRYPFFHYETTSEIKPAPGGGIQDMAQDSLGNLWMATYSVGVSRYNGITFMSFGKDAGISPATSLALHIDQYQRIWLLTDSGVFCSRRPLTAYDNISNLKFATQYKNRRLFQGSISQVGQQAFKLHADTLWTGTTAHGIVRNSVGPGKTSFSDTLQSLTGVNFSEYPVISLFVNESLLGVGTDSRYFLFERQGADFNLLIDTNLVISTQLLWQSTLFLGGGTGNIYKCDPGNAQTPITLFAETGKDVIYDLKNLRENELWAAAFGSGVFVYDLSDSRRKFHFSQQNGLLEDNAYRLLRTTDNSIFIGLSDGISKLKPNFEAYKSYVGLPYVTEPNVWAPLPEAEAPSGWLWTASTTGINCYNGESGRQLTTDDGLMHNWSYDVIADARGRVWIANYSGINVLSDYANRPTAFGERTTSTLNLHGKSFALSSYPLGITGLLTALPMRQHADSAQTVQSIWGNSYKSVYAYVDDKWFYFSQAAGLPAIIMYSLTMDDAGYVYVATGGEGLFKSKQPVTVDALNKLKPAGREGREIIEYFFEPFAPDSLLQNNRQNQEVLFSDDRLFIVMENILAAYTPEGVLLWQQKMDEELVNLAANEGDSVLWAGCGGGVYKISKSSGAILKKLSHQTGFIASVAPWLESLQIDPSGILYHGTDGGLDLYDPQKDTLSLNPPAPQMETFSYDENIWGKNTLRAGFSFPWFIDDYKPRILCKLQGFDDEWVELPTNDVRYTNLLAVFFDETYTLQAKIRNYDNTFTTPVLSYSFAVSPPIYLRWWMFFFYIAAAYFFTRGVLWLKDNLNVIIMSAKTRIVSHYKLKHELGKGGMGTVYLAQDLHDDDKLVALKLLHPELCDDLHHKKRLANESRILTSLDHPNIVPFYELGETADTIFLAMEYFEGRDLKKYILEEGPLDNALVVKISRQVLDAMRYIHGQGVIHRDLKNNNIMINEAGQVKILDFGLSKSTLITTMTTMGSVLGTLGYIAPEQITDSDIDERADIFSFGALLYEMLTRRMPFEEENEMALIFAIFNKTPEDPRTFNKNADPTLCAIAMKCLEKNKNDRYQNADEVLQQLEYVPEY